MKRISSISVICLLFLAGMSTHAQNPTRWRGPEGNGVYPDQGLLKVWPDAGPARQWVYEDLGQGHSSPMIQDGHIYVNGMIDQTGYLFKLDLNGKLVYRVKYGPEYYQSYPGTRGSPVVAGDKIYIVSGLGVLYCMNEPNGSLEWTVDMVKTYGGSVPRWGYNETVSIDGDLLYCTPGGRRNNVIALNRQNGDLVWSCRGKAELSAYCSSLLFTHGGKKILAQHTASHLLGINAASGELLWTRPQDNRYSVHANTPIYRDGGLLYFSGYGQGAAKIELNRDGTGVNQVWKNKGFDSRMGGAVVVDGFLYGSGDESNREWQCVDWNTGETLYSSGAIAKGNVISADGMLFCYSERGELALVRADPSGFNVISQTRVSEGRGQHWAHPCIHEGVLYLRHGNALIAYRIR